jgi:hypothetical protein
VIINFKFNPKNKTTKTHNQLNKAHNQLNKGKEGLQSGITHSFKSYGEPITLSSLHMGLYPSCGYVLLQGRSCTIKYLIKIK